MCGRSWSGSGRRLRYWLRPRSGRARGSARWGRYDGGGDNAWPAMRRKVYRATNMAAAMARVRVELGGDALILATRRVADGVEVTAAVEADEVAPPELAAMELAPPDPALAAALRYHGLSAEFAPASLTFTALPLETPLLFVGPPGAGKTLTVARLATRLVMEGSQPLVITADGKRAGATEELAAFTKLLGIRLVVACNPVTLGRALAYRSGAVLIDTPGCNPFAPAELQELSALAATATATPVLVLPAGLDPAEAGEVAHAFAAIGARQLLATRM